ncbi:hypothetical protein DRO66_09900 [Candidatus Bathyarchaeota archaeon]|nr:MAG: hypothetical protein DRO66_09900 [Candidatus Bathyarchaeota archaeon]
MRFDADSSRVRAVKNNRFEVEPRRYSNCTYTYGVYVGKTNRFRVFGKCYHLRRYTHADSSESWMTNGQFVSNGVRFRVAMMHSEIVEVKAFRDWTVFQKVLRKIRAIRRW